MSLIDDLAAAISTQEGYGAAAGNRPTRNNNPGNLRDSSGTIWPSLPHDSGGFVIVPSASAGWDALKHDLSLKAARGMTLEQTISAWAPAADGNNTAAYLASVAARTGLSPSDPINGAGGGDSSPVSAPESSGDEAGAVWEILAADPVGVGLGGAALAAAVVLGVWLLV